ncbi:Phosphatidylinositol 3,4,5-trisphosphate 5-phosphatase 2 [Geodia barretti]|nr:Phosphatidylinositol 3,4,5-trisphosphate 5-phosphatase 2 [Geodia barretti]
MERVDLLQSLFERAGGAKEVGKRSSLSRRRRSRAGETDFDSLSLKLRECSESVQSLETTSFQMLRELSAGITGQSRPAGSLGQVAPLVGGPPNNTPSNGEQEDEEEEVEVMFETKTEGLGHGRKYNIAVNLAEGKLTFKKHGESNSSSYSHQQVLQLIKSRSKEQRLGILLAGQNRKDHNFINMQAREQFCQLIQLIRNRMKAGTGMDQDSVSIFVGTWNMGDASPPGDISSWFRSAGKGKTLPHALAQPHDIYAIGTQECNVSEKEWLSKIRGTLKMVHDMDYEKLASQTLWGIRLVIFVKPEHINKITHVQGSQVRTGIGNALGNKGGVGITFFYGSVSMCFINCHLTSGNEKCSRRNQNYYDILKGMGALKQRKLNQFFLTNQFHHLFFFGDLNYRVDLGATEIVEFAKRENHGSIFKEDQLRKQMEQKKIFVGFDEAPILFPPTYRFARGRRSLDDYVWVKQKRAGIRLNVPSYCDRVLWCSYPGTIIANSSYGACTDIMTSDHSPLFASFQVGGVKQFVPEPGRGLGSGENQTFIIVDSLKAKIQTSSKTSFFVEIYSNCFEGVQRGSVNDEWIDTQAGYVWPVWCGRDHVFKVPPIVTQLEYLEQQHILILLKSTESDESYAECCVSLRGLFAPAPVSVTKTLIHQGQEIGVLEAYIHVTLDHYPKPEEDLYSDLNFITADDSSDLDSGRNRAIAHSFINSTSNGVGGRTSSMSDRSIHHVARSSTHSSSSSSSFSSLTSLRSHVSQQPLPSPPVPAEKPPPVPISSPPPPLPKRRDLSHRPSSAQDSPHQPPTPVARKPESIAVTGRQESTALLQALSVTSSGVSWANKQAHLVI